MFQYAAVLPIMAALVSQTVVAQQAGQWTMNASTPQTDPATTGCVILAQLTSTTTPPTLQAFYPICPSTTPVPTNPFTGATVHWPLSANAGDGQGIASDLLIYAQVTHKADRTDVRMAQAGCVMRLGSDQAQYLLGRSLTWNNNLQELWDNTGNGFILTPDNSATLACAKDATLLPESLWLPDPYIVPPTDAIWQQPLLLAVPKGPVQADQTTAVTISPSSSDPVVIGVETMVPPVSSSISLSSSSLSSFSATQSPAVIGVGLIGAPSSSISVSPTASPTASPLDPVEAIETECAKETVTEKYTTTVTAVPTLARRKGGYFMFS